MLNISLFRNSFPFVENHKANTSSKRNGPSPPLLPSQLIVPFSIQTFPPKKKKKGTETERLIIQASFNYRRFQRGCNNEGYKRIFRNRIFEIRNVSRPFNTGSFVMVFGKRRLQEIRRMKISAREENPG